MKSITLRIGVFAIICGACLNGVFNVRGATDASDATAMMSAYEKEQQAAEAARAKDAAWKPSCNEVGVIQVGDGKNAGALKNFCLNSDGNILACYSPNGGQKSGAGIRVYSPKGELLKTIPLEIKAETICVSKDGSIFAAGEGRLLKLDATGKVLASAESPVAKEKVSITKETEDMVKEMVKQSKQSYEAQLAQMKKSLEQRRSDVTGLAVTDQDVFMAVPAPSDFTYRVYRFNHSLQDPKLVVEKLRGCCGQMDIQSHDGNLWIPHNARHQVESHDRDGKQLAKFGNTGRVKASDFGGCCEPKNLRILANGDVLAAESGPPTCIKRFSANGKFMEVIAVANNSRGDCVRVTVEMSPDGKRYYLLDTTRDAIRIFAAKS